MNRAVAWFLTGCAVTALVAVLFCNVSVTTSVSATQVPRFVVLGDSIGVGLATSVGVTNCAQSGKRHEAIRFQLSCVKETPTHVVVSTGTNEASHRDNSVDADLIVQLVRTNPLTSSSVVVIAGPPCTQKWFQPHARAIDRFLSKTLWRYTYVSLQTFCADAADGVHHTRTQYEAMWDHILKEVR